MSQCLVRCSKSKLNVAIWGAQAKAAIAAESAAKAEAARQVEAATVAVDAVKAEVKQGELKF